MKTQRVDVDSLPLGTDAARTVVPSLFLVNGEVNPEAVRWYRQLHGMSQRELAIYLGCHPRTVGNIECGVHAVSETNTVLLYHFVTATVNILRDHDGIIPPGKSLKEHVTQTEPPLGVANMIEARERIRQLEAENVALRYEVEDYRRWREEVEWIDKDVAPSWRVGRTE